MEQGSRWTGEESREITGDREREIERGRTGLSGSIETEHQDAHLFVAKDLCNSL